MEANILSHFACQSSVLILHFNESSNDKTNNDSYFKRSGSQEISDFVKKGNNMKMKHSIPLKSIYSNRAVYIYIV